MNNYFCGWYFKCQSETQTLAFIPAIHIAGGEKSCSLQVITEKDAWNIPVDVHKFRKKKGQLYIQADKNIFSEKGMKLDIHEELLEVKGKVRFGSFRPLKYDIMGPFCRVPFMECRHSVYSMEHEAAGSIQVNGEEFCFKNGLGYVEGDRGKSFPRAYLWSQCHFPGGSLMLSVAEIPLGPLHFTGIISVVCINGREYRLATYLGAGAELTGGGSVCIRQGRSELCASLLEKKARPLLAPSGGAMVRTIRESPACTVKYSFRIDGEVLLDFVTDRAAFEFEYPENG